MRRPRDLIVELRKLFVFWLCCGFVTACGATISKVAASNATPKIGPPVQLKFGVQPSNSAGAGANFGTMPVVDVEDANGNVVTNATEVVTLAAYTDSTCMTVAPGTFNVSNNSLAPTSGVVSFSGVNYGGTSGITIYIGASASGLTSACSSAVTITYGAPTKLVFTTEPADPAAVAGTAFATQPVVTVEDAYGNVVMSASNAVTLAAYTDGTCTTGATGTFGAATNPVTPSSRDATFVGVNYTKAETVYIGASSSGLTSACSSAISVAAGAPAKLRFIIFSSSFLVNGCYSAQIQAADQYLNVASVTGTAVTVNLSASSGSQNFYSNSGCTSSISTSQISVGQSNTPTFYFSDSAVEYDTWSATATGLTSTGADGIYWQLQPILSFSPSTFATATCVPFTIQLEDYNGNAMSLPDTEYATLNWFADGSTYTNSSCTTGIAAYNLSIPASQSSITYYFSDIRAEGTVTPYISTNSGDTYLQNGPHATATINANSPNTLLVTGPTFEPPGTCAGPYTVTATDANHNPSNISGSALSVSLSATGSAQVYSDSGCASSTSSISIGVGVSSQVFYAKDTATEISSIHASASSFATGSFNLDSSPTSPLEQVASGGNYTCVLISGGVKCWGYDGDGELGDAGAAGSFSFTPISVSGLSSGVTQIIATNGFACAVKTDNTVWCWGYDGNITGGGYANRQIDVSGNPLLATKIASGGGEMCAITTTGAMYCAGGGYPNSTWTEILSSGATSVDVTDYVSCVNLAGGDLKCWGDNSNGGLGIGTTGGSNSVPQQVIGLTTGVASTAVSRDAGCALVSGAVKCWGYTGSGEANGGTPAAVGSPLNSGVASIAGGGWLDNGVFFAVTTSGALYGWGGEGGNDGVFANGSSAGYSYTSPHQIFSSGVEYFTVARPFSWNACAIVSGNLECWGDNGAGQIGNETLNTDYVPVYPQSLE